tara:strand:- start:636 stop:1529 length:894 start_codon:yes stop_codon:yes gene_type:complete
MTAPSHSIVFSGLSALVILLLDQVGVSTFTQLVVLSAAVALAGLPHGALDPLLAEHITGENDHMERVRFYLGYLFKAGVTFVFWFWQPEIALLLFLAISAWHFADDWRDLLPRRYQLGVGISMIVLPVFFRSSEVVLLFSFLGADWSPVLVSSVTLVPGALSCVIMCLAILYAIKKRSWVSLELLSLSALAVLTPPLIFFSVYFCLLHSPRHILKVVDVLKLSTLKVFIYGIIFTTLGALIAVSTVSSQIELNSNSGLAHAVFVGLFCLTVPHMFVVNKFRKKASDRVPHGDSQATA